jgi:DNA uptake protein ComE-like DNA-binding protein
MTPPKNSQDVRVAARSRIFSPRPDRGSPAPEDWIPAGFNGGAPVAEQAPEATPSAEARPADPAAAAELGAEVQRLRRKLDEAETRAHDSKRRADHAESELSTARARLESMKRAAAHAAAAAHPAEPAQGAGDSLDLNAASFEQLRALGLTVTQAARVIGQREQRGGFTSVEDVDAVLGLPRDLKQALKDHGSV